MPFCKNCGSAVEGQFCAKCGTPIAAPAAAGYTAPPPPPPPAQPYSQPYSQPGAAPYQPAATSGMADNVAGLLCYVLGLITGVLFLVIEPYNKNPFVRFHAFQSIFYNLAVIAFSIVFSILSAVVFAALPFAIWGLWHLVGMIVWLAVFAIWVLLLIKAYQGARFKLPFVGDLAEKQASR